MTDEELRAALDRYFAKYPMPSQKERNQIRGLQLTAKQAQAVTLMFEGMPMHLIAHQMGIGKRALTLMLNRVYRKAKVKDNMGLLAYAYRQGGFIW